MKKYAVFGNPIKHSMSPLIHSYFAKSLNIELSYEPILGSLDKFQTEAEKFLKNGGLGFNITLPFKQDAFNFAEIKSDIAMITGSVNTISLKGGVIHGDNTDGSGFTKDLKNNIKYEVANKKILILGAGGAAMGVIPNVLSEDDVFVCEDKRQKPCGEKKINSLMENLDPVVCTENWNRNDMLINLDKIPDDIVNLVVQEWETPIVGSKSKVFNYFIEHKLKNLMGDIQEF